MIPAGGFTNDKHHVGVIDALWGNIGKVLAGIEHVGCVRAFIITGVGKQPQRRKPVGRQIRVRNHPTIARQIDIGDLFLGALLFIQGTQRQPHQRNHRQHDQQWLNPLPWRFHLFDQGVAQVIAPDAQQR
ncbi:hypothetical protein D3C75_1124870 [compost metagenome]